MLPTWTTPLSMVSCKLNDILLFDDVEQTPFDPVLTVYNIADAIIYGPAAYDVLRDGVKYWSVPITVANGFGARLFYKVVVSDGIVNGHADKTWMIYVNNEVEFENLIVRSAGLAGDNLWITDHAWTNGQLTSFTIKTYASAANLNAAIAGTSDNYIASYSVTLLYNNNYNCVQITCTKD